VDLVADFIPFKAKYLALAAVMLIGAGAGILPITLLPISQELMLEKNIQKSR
jgi:hypothetical protein